MLSTRYHLELNWMYSPKSATIPTSIRLLYRKNLEVIMDEQLLKRDWELSL